MTSHASYVVGHVEEALAHAGETDVHVRVAPGRLVLTGNVPTVERRDAIGAIAATVGDELEVHNEVTVVPLAEPRGSETLP